MLRKLAAVVVGLLGLFPLYVQGLGVGSIELESHLNQPLRAKIALLQVRDLSVQEILPSLASKSAFQSAGVERNYFVTQLRFSVHKDSEGQTYILVKSRQPAREPFLNFLLEVHWPAGKILREFTVLLDPPEFKEELPLAIASPVLKSADPIKSGTTQTSEVKSKPEKPQAKPEQQEKKTSSLGDSLPPSIAEPPKKEEKKIGARPIPKVGEVDWQALSKENTSKNANAPVKDLKQENPALSTQSSDRTTFYQPDEDEDSYKVQKGDTLWKIADRLSKPSGTSVQQTMIAIQQVNQDAFIDGNVNLVKVGKVLRLPSGEDIQRISRSDALKEFSRQNNAWRAKLAARKNKTLAEKPLTERIDGAGRGINTEKPVVTEEGTLTLVAPGDSDASEGGASIGEEAEEGGGSGLSNSSALRIEEIEKEKRVNEELSMELMELQQQIDTADQLINLKNDQLTALVSQLDEIEKQINELEESQAEGSLGLDPEVVPGSEGEGLLGEGFEEGVEEGVETGTGLEGIEEEFEGFSTQGESGEEQSLEANEQNLGELLGGETEVEESVEEGDIGGIETSGDQGIAGLLKDPKVLGALIGAAVLLLIGIVLLFKSRRDDDDDDDFDED